MSGAFELSELSVLSSSFPLATPVAAPSAGSRVAGAAEPTSPAYSYSSAAGRAPAAPSLRSAASLPEHAAVVSTPRTVPTTPGLFYAPMLNASPAPAGDALSPSTCGAAGLEVRTTAAAAGSSSHPIPSTTPPPSATSTFAPTSAATALPGGADQPAAPGAAAGAAASFAPAPLDAAGPSMRATRRACAGVPGAPELSELYPPSPLPALASPASAFRVEPCVAGAPPSSLSVAPLLIECATVVSSP